MFATWKRPLFLLSVVSFFLFWGSVLVARSQEPFEPPARQPFSSSSYEDIDEFFDFIGREIPPALIEKQVEVLGGGFRADFSNGAATTTISSGSDAARGSLFQSDGNLIVVGRAHNDFAAIRYIPSGQLDTTFNTSGTIVTSFSGGGNNIAHSAAMDTTGKFFAAGRVWNGAHSDFAIVKYNTNGTLDTSFATLGKVIFDILADNDVARGMGLDALGRPLLAGYSDDGSKFVASVIRLTTEGNLDTTFSTDGKATVNLSANDSGALSISIDSSNRAILGGNAYNGTDWDAALARFETDGTLDTSFLTSGSSTFSEGTGSDTIYGLALDSSGRILGAGSSRVGTYLNFLVTRLNSNGAFDTSFFSDGKRTVTVENSSDDTGYAIAALGNGKTVIGGAAYIVSNNNFAIVRLLSNGALDSAFGGDGIASTLIGSGDDFAMALSHDRDSVYYLAGRARNGSNWNIAVARFGASGNIGRSGDLNPAFATNGALAFTAYCEGSRIILATDGRMSVSCKNTLGNYYFYRLMTNGGLDTSFFTRGTSTAQGYSHMVQTDGKYVTAGNSLLQRINSNGTLDTSFRSTGLASLPEVVIYLTGDSDRIMGISTNSIYRVLSNGNVDTSFSTGGRVVLTTAAFSDVAVIPDSGGYLAWGNVGSLDPSFHIYRITSNGRLDTAFGTVGYIAPQLGGGVRWGARMQVSDNKMTFPVTYDELSGSQVALVRLTSNGLFDTSFYGVGFAHITGGWGSSPTYLSVVQKGGRTLFSRYRLNGVTIDTTFGTNGVLATTLWAQDIFETPSGYLITGPYSNGTLGPAQRFP